MAEASEAPKVKIIYKKRKGGGGHGHHGGAWKVAFADFMTAMMALFLVLWIMAQSQEVKSAVAYYFRHPTEYEGKPDSLLRGNDGLMEIKNGRMDNRASLREGNSNPPPGGGSGLQAQSVAGGAARMNAEPGLRPEPIERIEEDPDEVRDFLKLSDLLWEELGLDPSYMRFKDQVTIETMEDGMLVQLMELPDQPLLEDHTFKFTPTIKRALAILAKKLKSYPNKIEIDGHGLGTASDPAEKWVGSTLLANLARQELEAGGIKATQITRIAGCADTRPLDPKTGANPLNRRVSIMVHPKQWRPDRY